MLPVIYRFTFDTDLSRWLLYAFGLGLIVYSAWSGWQNADGGVDAKGQPLEPSKEDRRQRAIVHGLIACGLVAFGLYYALPQVPFWGPGKGEGIPIHTYGILVGSGFITAVTAAGWMSMREWPGKLGLERRQQFFDLAFYIFVGAMIGSRVLFIIVNYKDYASGRMSVFDIGGGLVFQGGFVGASAVAYWYTRKHGIEFARIADIALPTVSLGAAFGRLGCFSAGCCWGRIRAAGSAIAVHFPGTNVKTLFGTPSSTASLAFSSQRDDPRYVVEATGKVSQEFVEGAVKISDWAASHGHTLPVHPTQLYESAAQVLLFMGFVLLRPFRRFHGQISALWLMVYSIERSTVELFRGDLERGTIHGTLKDFGMEGLVPQDAFYNLSTSQLGSLAIFAAGAFILYRQFRVFQAQPKFEVEGLGVGA
jgi:phosphatidylglycerol:prolipoprotein diacylglycerol transferase